MPPRAPSPDDVEHAIRSFLRSRSDARANQRLSVARACKEWLRFLKTNRQPDGDLKKDGTLSSHYEKAIYRLKPLSEIYGTFDVRELRALDLKEFQRNLLSGCQETGRKPWVEETVNQAVADVRRLYAWLELYERVPLGTVEHLKTVRNLPVERAERETIDDHSFETVLKYVNPVIATVARIQRLTATRPSELLVMRLCDIFIDGENWTYWPSHHKGQHLHIDRPIPLGPKCQELLAPYMVGRKDEEYLFQPAEADMWWRTNQMKVAGRKQRATPRYPSEVKRLEEQKLRRPKSGRVHAKHFTRQTYYQAIKRGVGRARKAGEKVDRWFPYLIRHTRITETQAKHGWEAARAVAGHRHLSTTKIYAHLQQERDLKVARDLQ